MKKFLFVIVWTIYASLSFGQTLTQNIKGKIVDRISKEPLSFATITIKGSDPIIGTTSDLDGNFVLADIPLGRYDIEASYIGYEPVQIPEIVLTSTKEVVLNIELNEISTNLGEVVIKPRIIKNAPINSMASVSARMLSVEEASRYAGGFDDPARLASSFAGVASSVSNNAIVIRGNAPKFLQWKIEGIEIPNPNHFADLSAFGGGGLTALSSNLLANSDFYTGAFPAEYTNALSGVFDIKMRTGNSSEYEHSIEIGAIGLDFASEGPISKKNNSSYLVNYRYSTLGLISSMLPEDAQGTNYQDLAFKVKLPSKKWGNIFLWGIGLIDNSGTIPEKDSTLHFYYQDRELQDVKQYMGAIGFNHRMIWSDNAFLNSTLAYSTNGIDLFTDRLDDNQILRPENLIKVSHSNLTLASTFNKKFSNRHSTKTGIKIRQLGYDIKLSEAMEVGEDLTNVVNDSGNTFLLNAFTSSRYQKEDFTLTFGLNNQIFTLNNNFSIEPRVGIAYQMNQNQTISLGYGLHSRIEPLPVYFANTGTGEEVMGNRDLDFSKAHHIVLSYDVKFTDKLHFKVEPYFQRLFNIPIKENSEESLLNQQNDWFVDDVFSSTGVGQNYGIDLTLEHYIHNGFYFLISGSLFNSMYKTEKHVWYNTRFNKNYLFNGLIGKEFRIGKRQSLLGFNFRASIQGGDKYSIIDDDASRMEQDIVFNELVPFSEQTSPSKIFHFTFNYEWYRKSGSHRISIKVLNASNFKEFQGFRYNLKTNAVEEFREALIIPNVSYKFSF